MTAELPPLPAALVSPPQLRHRLRIHPSPAVVPAVPAASMQAWSRSSQLTTAALSRSAGRLLKTCARPATLVLGTVSSVSHGNLRATLPLGLAAPFTWETKDGFRSSIPQGLTNHSWRYPLSMEKGPSLRWLSPPPATCSSLPAIWNRTRLEEEMSFNSIPAARRFARSAWEDQALWRRDQMATSTCSPARFTKIRLNATSPKSE